MRRFILGPPCLMLAVMLWPAQAEACGGGTSVAVTAVAHVGQRVTGLFHRHRHHRGAFVAVGECVQPQAIAPSAVIPMPMATALPARFSVGDHVNHVANPGGLFPAGAGVITSVLPWNSGDGNSYQLRCDMTGQVLPVVFKGRELTPYVSPQAVPPKAKILAPAVVVATPTICVTVARPVALVAAPPVTTTHTRSVQRTRTTGAGVFAPFGGCPGGCPNR